MVDSGVSEKLIIQDKLFKNAKYLLFMKINRFITAPYSVQKLTAKKKKFFEKKLKDLWKAIKSLGLPNKSGGCIVGVLAENQIVKHDTKSILKPFKSFYSSLAGNLLAKLAKPPNS